MQKKKHRNDLETIDHMILRTIIGAQAKAPVETPYQETLSIFNRICDITKKDDIPEDNIG